jgi:hypothetical protein
VVFSIEAAEQGELTIQESTDGASWLPTSDPAVFLVTASERGAVCLTPTAAGRYFRPAFKAYRAASRVWCLAQNWAA